MNVFDEIQTEILSAASLSMVLRKAKVLAYRGTCAALVLTVYWHSLFKTYRINIKPRRLGSIHASSPFTIPLNSPLSLRNRRRHIACLTQSKLSPDLAHYTLMKLYS